MYMLVTNIYNMYKAYVSPGWEQQIMLFDASSNSSIVACVFVIAVTFLPSRCLATLGGFSTSCCHLYLFWRSIILPVVLYGCETWSLTLREEHRLRVFENRVLRRIFWIEEGWWGRRGIKPEGKRPLGRPKRRWEDNIKMDLKDRVAWYGLDWSG
jgi:hypothetical protein